VLRAPVHGRHPMARAWRRSSTRAAGVRPGPDQYG
jgi:hypothetical protein